MPWGEIGGGNHQNFPAKQTTIAMVRIQRIGANSIHTPIEGSCDIPEGEGTTLRGAKTSYEVDGAGSGARAPSSGCEGLVVRVLGRLMGMIFALGGSEVGSDWVCFFKSGLGRARRR